MYPESVTQPAEFGTESFAKRMARYGGYVALSGVAAFGLVRCAEMTEDQFRYNFEKCQEAQEKGEHQFVAPERRNRTVRIALA